MFDKLDGAGVDCTRVMTVAEGVVEVEEGMMDVEKVVGALTGWVEDDVSWAKEEEGRTSARKRAVDRGRRGLVH